VFLSVVVKHGTFFFLLFFQNLHFWAFLKDLGHPREFKNNTIMLKFATLVDWLNT